MNRKSNSIMTMCEIGIFAALGYVFDELQSIITKGIFINGGSIGFAMIAVLIIAFRRGWLPAILTGLLIGLLDLATGAYILHPAQLLLDYVLPYAVVGLVGVLKPFFDRTEEKKSKILWLVAGTIIGGMLKFLSHYFAGIIFWADPEYFAWGLNSMNPYLYCFVYNIAFIGPSILLTIGVMVVTFINAPRVLIPRNVAIGQDQEVNNIDSDIYSWTESIVYGVGGGFLFVYYLIQYILSFGDYTEGSAYGFDFDPDCMLIFVIGFMFLILGVNTFIATIRKKHIIKYSYISAVSFVGISLVYAIARLIRMYSREEDPTTYWIWLIAGVGTIIILTVAFTIKVKLLKKKGD